MVSFEFSQVVVARVHNQLQCQICRELTVLSALVTLLAYDVCITASGSGIATCALGPTCGDKCVVSRSALSVKRLNFGLHNQITHKHFVIGQN